MSSSDSKPPNAAKTEWPELLCKTIKEAKETIKSERPDLEIQVVTVGTMVTQEFNEKRVRIWVDKVAEVLCLRIAVMSSSDQSKTCHAPKTEWPELVGRTIKEAKATIKKERPDLKIEVVTVGTSVTEEFNLKRVRIWVDTVAEIPRIG
ncbi:hypothetical protein ABZP36_030514 [Zizania latifolia]